MALQLPETCTIAGTSSSNIFSKNGYQARSVSGMPVLGSIGEVVTDAVKAERARRLRLFVGGAGALGVAFVLLLGLEFAQRGLVA